MTDQPLMAPPSCEDYSVTDFKGVSVSLHRLFYENIQTNRQPLIRGKTFTDCVIQGPSVLLALSGVVFDACNLGAAGDEPRSLILMPMAKNTVIGPIAVAECTFTRCDFMGIGYTGPDAFIDNLLQVLEGGAAQPADNG